MSVIRLRKDMIITAVLFALLLFGVILIGLWQVNKSEAVATATENTLVVAFEESGSEFQELTAQSWGKIEGGGKSLEEIYALFEKIEKEMGDKAEISIEESSDDYYVGITVTGKTKEGYALDLTVQSISDSYEEDETYLIVNLKETLDYREASKMAKVAESYFEVVKAKGETSVLITGSLKKVLNKKSKTALVADIFTKVGGKIIEGVENESYVSKSGFCPGMHRSIVNNGEEINMQVAVMDNEVKNRSEIYIGTPLIFSEY